jgi:small subunit ribosomal protein S8
MNPISDFLIRIKNAGMAEKTSVSAPFSNMKFAIANLLSKKGFVGQVSKKGRKNNKSLEVNILYSDGKPRIGDIKLMSKPSRRQYGKAKELRSYRQGYGMTVLSTPKGILAHSDARKENVGGEILFKIW